MTKPYLSVVVTSRHDGHGGDPLRRLQNFVNTLAAQCRRFALDAELIVVDWNPPPDRPRLHEVVGVPADCPFPVRFIEVPPPLHNSLPNQTVMPLFQMIAKNVGVRRARGEFVLCSNIDIIFSNALVQFFASRRLRHGVLYRIDRHDIESDYPWAAPLDEQLAYCQSHHLRLHRAWGSSPTDSDGRVVAFARDVFDPPSVTIGDGWHVREGNDDVGFYRWVSGAVTLRISRGAGHASGVALALDIEPNPYDPRSWVDFEIAAGGRTLTRTRIDARRRLRVPLPDDVAAPDLVLTARAVSQGSDQMLPAFERRQDLAARVMSVRLVAMPAGLVASAPYAASRWQPVHRDAALERNSDDVRVRSAASYGTYAARYAPFYAPRSGRYTFAVELSCVQGNISMHIMDEATGRFVTADEFETVAGDRRVLVASAELTAGQAFALYLVNRHRTGDAASTFVIHALRGSVGLSDLELHARARVLAGAARRALRRGLRSLSRRAAGLLQTPIAARPAVGTALPGDDRGPAAISHAADSANATTRIERYCRTHRLPALNRNAAGDFQLMAKRHWFELHGYAEFTMYSMNVDGLLDEVAYHADLREETLSMPCCIYHLEHTQGSGWTPEGEGLLRKRLAESGADWLDAATVDLWSAYMDWLKRPMLFNPANWGFGDSVLPEVTIAPTSNPVDVRR